MVWWKLEIWNSHQWKLKCTVSNYYTVQTDIKLLAIAWVIHGFSYMYVRCERCSLCALCAKHDQFSSGDSSIMVLRCARDMLSSKAKSHTECIIMVRNIRACIAFPGFFYLRSKWTFWKFTTSMIILLIFKICICGFFVNSCFSSIFCVWMCFTVCISVYHINAWCPLGLEKGFRGPGSGIKDGCEPLRRCWECNPGLME